MMKTRLLFGFGLLAFVLAPVASGQQLDIALEGPWILYQDQNFRDKNDKLVTVLVAIAPLAAAMDEPIDFQHHHVPQISAGEGYYIGDKGIYCLDFDGQCAPKGASSLTDDHGYPTGQLLPISAGTSAPWPWPQKSSGNVAIILPMPDFYSNDGLWQIRFRNTYDIKKISVTHKDLTASIGIMLHYQQNGAAVLRLFSCDATTPSAKNCTTQAKDRDGNDVILRNTATLRMQLRAPDADSECDHHVRFAYHQMFKIFENSSSNLDYAYIEPAKHIAIASNGNASGGYEDESSGNHDCFDEDHDTYQDQAVPAGSPFNPRVNGEGQAVTQEETTFAGALTDLNKLNKDLKSPFLERAIVNVNAASKESDKLKGIRKISVDRHFEALLSDAIALIDTAKRNKQLTSDELTTLLKVETFLRILADGTKNGADCRAPLVLLQ